MAILILCAFVLFGWLKVKGSKVLLIYPETIDCKSIAAVFGVD